MPEKENPDQITYFAKTNFRNQMVKFGIKRDDRRRHMYLIGKTGMGKSNTLENMVIDDILSGNGVCLIDPHGDAAEKMLNFIPDSRINDVVYFNPADMNFPIAFNILETVDQHKKHLVASGLIGIFKKIWADSWGPRLEYLLRNAILALLDYEGSTLLGITRILSNKAYRKKVVEKITDPVVKAFWVEEYAKYPDKFQQEAIAPIQNKVGQFLSNSMIRNIVGQVKSTIDMREIMDSKKIFIVNLSKGRIGEDTSSLLGSMIITKLYLAAMERVDMREDDRKDFYVYVDEFQNFATDSFANILSEARKYRLSLIIAHQYIEQLDEKVAAAVFGNVGTIITFRVGATDAEQLEKEFAPHIVLEDLVSLDKFTVYLRLMIDGVASSPFSATTLPPINQTTDNHDKVVIASRERYSNALEDVERKIALWAESMSSDLKEDERIASTQPPNPFKNKPKPFAPKTENQEVVASPTFVKPLAPEKPKIDLPIQKQETVPLKNFVKNDFKKPAEQLHNRRSSDQPFNRRASDRQSVDENIKPEKVAEISLSQLGSMTVQPMRNKTANKTFKPIASPQNFSKPQNNFIKKTQEIKPITKYVENKTIPVKLPELEPKPEPNISQVETTKNEDPNHLNLSKLQQGKVIKF
jgi:hypothetical protein